MLATSISEEAKIVSFSTFFNDKLVSSEMANEANSRDMLIIQLESDLKSLSDKLLKEQQLREEAEQAKSSMENQLEDLSRSLFEEAQNMVREARKAQNIAETSCKRAKERLAEMEELLQLKDGELRELKKRIEKDQNAIANGRRRSTQHMIGFPSSYGTLSSSINSMSVDPNRRPSATPLGAAFLEGFIRRGSAFEVNMSAAAGGDDDGPQWMFRPADVTYAEFLDFLASTRTLLPNSASIVTSKTAEDKRLTGSFKFSSLLRSRASTILSNSSSSSLSSRLNMDDLSQSPSFSEQYSTEPEVVDLAGACPVPGDFVRKKPPKSKSIHTPRGSGQNSEGLQKSLTEALAQEQRKQQLENTTIQAAFQTIFMKRVQTEDVDPCLKFDQAGWRLNRRLPNSCKDGQVYLDPIRAETLLLPVLEATSTTATANDIPKAIKCALCGLSMVLPINPDAPSSMMLFRLRFEEESVDNWNIQTARMVCCGCRRRLVAVCEFYSYTKLIVRGLVGGKRSAGWIWRELTKRRWRMWMARNGAGWKGEVTGGKEGEWMEVNEDDDELEEDEDDYDIDFNEV